VVTVLLANAGKLQHFVAFFRWENVSYNKVTVCQSAGFIEGENVCFGKSFQVVATFYQHAHFAGCGDATEKSHWHGYYQRAWAGYKQKHHGTL
jgi:hypothetical protein